MKKKVLYLNGDSWTRIFWKNILVKKILYEKYSEIICDAQEGASNKDIWISTKNSIKKLDKDSNLDVCIFLTETLRGDKELNLFEMLCKKYETESINFLCIKLLELYKKAIEKELLEINCKYEITTAFINCPWKTKILPMYKIIIDSLHIKENHECYSVSPPTLHYSIQNFSSLNFTEKEKYNFLFAAKERIKILDKIGEPDYDLHVYNENYLKLIAKTILEKL